MFDKYGEFAAPCGIDPERVILETHDLTRQYEQSDEVITAVNRVNIRIREGEFVAVVGPSGSGKSTLLHLLAGLDRPSAGAVFIRGQDITAMDDDTLARFRGEYVGVVFQEHNLIPQFTALENILIPTMMCRKPDTAYEENLKKLVAALGIAARCVCRRTDRQSGSCQCRRSSDASAGDACHAGANIGHGHARYEHRRARRPHPVHGERLPDGSQTDPPCTRVTHAYEKDPRP